MFLGGARGAVAMPPILAIGIAGLLYANHCNWIAPPGEIDPIYDNDGCIHAFIHHAAAYPTLFAVISVSLVALFCAAPAIHGFHFQAFKTRIRIGIDRELTRVIRVHSNKVPGWVSGECIWVSRWVESNGPFSLPVGRRNCIFLPPSILQHLEDLPAVLQHERSHFAGKHFLRRWIFEVLLATLIPRLLLHYWHDAAREEEEFQADDRAVEMLGSSALVAKALIRSAERVAASGSRCAATCRMLQDGDLEFRVKRLFDVNRIRPRPIWTTVSVNITIALAICSILAANSNVGVVAFCAFERLLGVSCF